MTRSKQVIVSGVLFTMITAPAFGQLCGDVNNDNRVSVADVYEIVGYLNWGEFELETGTGTFDWENADCDGKAGITVGDQIALCQYLWVSLETPLYCPSIGDYEVPFPDVSTDTVFIPELFDIPDGIDRIVLAIDVSPEGGGVDPTGLNTTGYYVPLLMDDEALVNFEFAGATWSQNYFVFSNVGRVGESDTVVFSAAPPHWAGWLPRMSLAWLTFERTAPGTGQIAPKAVSRSQLMAPSVAKPNRNLYQPAISYYAATMPEPTGVLLSADQATFFCEPGGPAPAPQSITVSGESQEYEFEIDISDIWIQVTPPPPVILSTPVSLDIGVNPESLSPGVYVGYVDLSNINPAQTGFTSERVLVGLVVIESPASAYPLGDLNCSGTVSISDIGLLIDHLFISQEPIPPCD
jgi:hypothetical protein